MANCCKSFFVHGNKSPNYPTSVPHILSATSDRGVSLFLPVLSFSVNPGKRKPSISGWTRCLFIDCGFDSPLTPHAGNTAFAPRVMFCLFQRFQFQYPTNDTSTLLPTQPPYCKQTASSCGLRICTWNPAPPLMRGLQPDLVWALLDRFSGKETISICARPPERPVARRSAPDLCQSIPQKAQRPQATVTGGGFSKYKNENFNPAEPDRISALISTTKALGAS